MVATTNRALARVFCAASALLISTCYAAAPSGQATQAPAATRAVAKRIGAIKAINGSEITLTPDSGPDVKITVQAATQIVRFAPGETNVNNATPIQLQDLQVGDRIRATGWASDDDLPLPVLKIVVMTHSDLEARHQHDLQDWQKRGADGLASAVDPAGGTITISSRGKSLLIHVSGTTVIRRYPPDSVKFEDAKPSTLQEVHPGDQVRARGNRSADGNDLTAEEIVSGTFRNFAGTINSVDASSSTLSIHDLLSKKTVLIKITSDSQLRKLPPEMAQMMAKRLKGAVSGSVPGATPVSSPPVSDQSAGPAGASGASGGSGPRAGGPPDLQRLISHAPAISLTDLNKGDAVVILSTEGTASGTSTAITLVSGVEPILQAAPNAGQAMMLAPWSLGAPAADAGGP